MISKTIAIRALTPAADQSDYEGYLVNVAAGVATVSTSATTRAVGVILEGENTDGKSAIGILGGNLGIVRMKAAGTIAEGAYVQQHTDGRVVTDAESGARVLVGIAQEAAVANDLFDVVPITPVTYA